MLNKLLVKILNKFEYVNELENKRIQLEAVVERLQNEKSEAVAENKRQEFRYKQLESAMVNMIEEPHMIFADAQGKYVCIDPNVIEKNKNKYVTCVHSFPVNSIILRVKG